MASSADDLRDRPIGELLKQLSEETTTLVRQELDLAKAEMAQKGKQVSRGAGFISGAAICGLGSLGLLSAALVALLATAIDHVWLSALIVAAVDAAMAGVLALQGRDKLKEATPPAPQTVETLKEDVQWAKTQKRSGTT
jgi:hypothetical protein